MDTYPKIIIASQINDTTSGNGSALIRPRTFQSAGLPDTNQTTRVETKVDTIAGSLHHGRVVGPATSGARPGVGVADSRADEGCGRGQEAGDTVEEHDRQ
jgi:hypothetical protein